MAVELAFARNIRQRVLPPDEYPRLVGTELEQVWPVLPRDSTVLVVEQGDQIVGCWAVIRYVHVEGLWIHPDHRRKSSVGARLWKAMKIRARELGATAVVTGAVSDDVRRLLAHAGGIQIPADTWVLPIGGD